MARKTVKTAKPKRKAGGAKAKPKRKPAAKGTRAKTRTAAKPRVARAVGKPTPKKRTTAAKRKPTASRPKAKPKGARARTPSRAKAAVKRPAARRRVKIPKWMVRMRGVLETERDRLIDRLEHVGNFSNDGARGATAEIATTDDDTIDMASQAVERERELALRSNLEDLLERVDKALTKIGQGEYGVCERCGEKISRERLKAVPHATMCVRCRAIIDG